MPSTELLWPGYLLEVDRPGEFVHTNMPEADPAWTFVDSEGHGHFWKNKGYPTLRWISEPCTMGHDDCDAEGHYECAVCGEEIQPGSRTAQPIWIPGFVTYTLTTNDNVMERTWRFGEDQWTALNDAVRQAIDETLAAADLVSMRQVGPRGDNSPHPS